MRVVTTGMWRLSRFPATEPFFSRNGQHRFDDPAGAAAPRAAFGVLYVAQSAETAFCETVIHENALWANDAFEVSSMLLNDRHLIGYYHPTKSELMLADLTGSGLKRLGLNNDLSSGDDYAVPQAWSAAIHRALPEVDGIRYRSRQNNGQDCFAIFDRSGLLKESSAALSKAGLDLLCRIFNVREV